MDSIVSLGQKNTLVDYMILFGADNRPPMLDKDLYDSWKTYKENGVIRTKKYAELSAAKKIQADCDIKATNIILQGHPADIYLLVNHHKVAKDLWERVQLLMQGFVVPVFSPGDDLVSCLNKAMAFLTAVDSSRGDRGKIILVLRIRAMLRVQGETLQVDRHELLNATTAKILGIPAGQAQTIIPHNAAFQTRELDTYNSDCDDLSNEQAVLMANISNYGSDVISEIPNSKTCLNDMDNQSVHALQDFEQSPVMDFIDNKKVQRLKPTLYDGIVIFEKHVAIPVIDDEETLILEDESRSKMSEKAKDPKVIAKKISHKPIDYEKLNRLTDDFGKRFTPQQELSAEHAFWLCISNPTIEYSLPPVRVERSESCLNLDAEFSKSKKAYNDLLKKYSQLEKHYISLEVSMQLKQEVFQNDESCDYQNAPEILEYFKNNALKAQLKDKDTTIYKLKDTIKCLRKTNKEEIVDHDRCDLVTINEELENSVAKLHSENERVKCSTSASGSKPSGNTKNNRISQPSSSNKINKVEDQPRSIKTRQNNKNRVKKLKCDDHVMQSMSNENFISIIINNASVKNSVNDVKSGCLCANCGKCMIVETHHACVHLLVPKMNESQKSKSAKKHKNPNVWKPTDHVFTEVVQIVLWYLDSGCWKQMKRNRSQLMNFVSKFIGTVRFENDQIAMIMYGDYQLGNVIISRKNACSIRNLEGVDLLSRSRDINLYIIYLDDMLKSSSVCLLSKASKTKSWEKQKSSHQPKAEETNQEKLYLLHMDLCGPMRVASINEKRNELLYIHSKACDYFASQLVLPLIYESIAITFDLPTMEPEDSLRMGDEHLNTTSKTKSDEFIKSSVENLVPNLSESEDLSDNQIKDFSESNEEFSSTDDDSFSFDNIDYVEASPLDSELVSSEGDMLLFEAILSDDHSFDFKIKSSSTSLNSLLEETNNFNNSLPEFKTFSKVLFDAECESDSGDDQSCFDKDVLEKIVLKPLCKEEIIPMKSLPDCDPEEEIHLIEKLLYDNSSPRPPKKFIFENSDAAIKSFSLFPIPVEDSDSLMEEIDLSFTLDDSMSRGIENDDYDFEVDMLILEEFLSNDSLSLPENESFDFDIPSSSRPFAKPPDDDEIKPNSRILTIKVKLLYDNSSPHPSKEFISENSDAAIESFSPSPIPIEDSDYLMKEIDLSFTPDGSMPSGIEEDEYDSERDMLVFEELLSNDSLSLPENKSFYFDIPLFLRPPDDPWREHSYLGCSISPFLPSTTSSSMGESGQAE
nr:hypothetical protein [Tanacetum cinerariifolium]